MTTGPTPQDLRHADAYRSGDDREVIGVSLWDAKESCGAWPASEAEARRRRAMAPYVVAGWDSFRRGRELATGAVAAPATHHTAGALAQTPRWRRSHGYDAGRAMPNRR